MTERAKEYMNDPNYVTFTDAVKRVGIDPLTFKRYAARLQKKGVPVGKYTFWKIEDVEAIENLCDNQVDMWIRMIERATGKVVTLSDR